MESTTIYNDIKAINNDIKALNEVRELLNEIRSNLLRKETKRIREKLYNFLKEKDSLTNKEKKELKNISIHLKNLKKHFKKLQKYQYSLDYLFNEHNDDYRTEPISQNNDIKAIKEVRELFNELKSNYSYEQRKKIREKLYDYLKEKEQKGSLTNKHKNVLNNINKYLKNLKKDLEKYDITYGLDYLFNELNEDYYEPKEVKSAFDGSDILYESRGDKDSKLAIYEYSDIIKPYLRDMIDYYKARGEWKIQLSMRIIFDSFTDANKTLVMHTKSDIVVIMSGKETNDIINELYDSFVRYQEGLETKMREADIHSNVLIY